MTTYPHTLTAIEVACGVTLEDVARELERGAFIDNGAAFIVAATDGPALAGSVARCAFAGAEIRYAGMNAAGMPVYRRA